MTYARSQSGPIVAMKVLFSLGIMFAVLGMAVLIAL